MFLLFLCYILVINALTSCSISQDSSSNNNSFSPTDSNYINNQEWLATIPKKIIVTNLLGKSTTIVSKVAMQSLINNLKLIHLEEELNNNKMPNGNFYSVTLQYTNTKILYRFLETKIWLTIGDDEIKVFKVDPNLCNAIVDQLRNIC